MKDEIKKTDIQVLYEKGVNFLRLRNTYSNTDVHYRMVYGDQWAGQPKGPVENIQYNILQPIVDFKVGTINSNLWAINYSSENFENNEFRETATKACENLNRHAARIWEKDDMDYKIYYLSEDACIDSEGVIYVNFDLNTKEIKNELINKVDVYYGNENSPDIQTQPYIIIKSRKPIDEVRQIAKDNGVSEEELINIVGDMDTSQEAGEQAKNEVNDMCILLTKMWKENGKVWYAKATKSVNIIKGTDSGLSLYPIEHFVWKNVKGSSRGVGEVQYLISNQLEINKTAMRRALSVKLGAYPKQVVNEDRISNASDIDKIGVTLKAKGTETDDVRKIFNSTTPSSMSSDAKELQTEMITNTRDLANAGDSATGQIDPEQASGRAILAVQQASQQPLKKQERGLKRCIEGLARIWFDIWKVYSIEGKEVLEEVEQINPNTNETETIEVPTIIPDTVLEQLKVATKVDITPTGAFDRFAKEMSLENLYMNNKLTDEEWVETLDDNSVMPKQKLVKIMEKRKKEQNKIAEVKKAGANIQSEIDGMIGGEEMTNEANAPVMEPQPV